jgi:[acyl-carrier-protein] S-malonyltransferase
VYGGAAIGSMRSLADGALAASGSVVGVLPRFMYDMELAHPGLTELVLVNDLHERKRKMIDEVDAVVACPVVPAPTRSCWKR